MIKGKRKTITRAQTEPKEINRAIVKMKFFWDRPDGLGSWQFHFVMSQIDPQMLNLPDGIEIQIINEPQSDEKAIVWGVYTNAMSVAVPSEKHLKEVIKFSQEILVLRSELEQLRTKGSNQ